MESRGKCLYVLSREADLYIVVRAFQKSAIHSSLTPGRVDEGVGERRGREQGMEYSKGIRLKLESEGIGRSKGTPTRRVD